MEPDPYIRDPKLQTFSNYSQWPEADKAAYWAKQRVLLSPLYNDETGAIMRRNNIQQIRNKKIQTALCNHNI